MADIDFDALLRARGLGAIAQFFGHVATGAWHHTTQRAASSQMNSRSSHVMRASSPTLQFQDRNFFGNAEASGAPLTISGSLQYLDGTTRQVTWGGATSITIPAGAEVLSDPVDHMLRPNTQFYRRTFLQCSTGVLHCSTNGAGNGTQSEFGTGALVDKTMSGSIPSSNNFYTPSAILGMNNRPAIGLVGDSLSVPVGEGAPDTTPDLGLARAMASLYALQKQAVGGETMANFMGANGTKRRASLQYASHIACFYGRNDINVAGGAQTLADRFTTLAAMFPDKFLIASTITPGTTSTDSWATTANQTVLAFESERVKYNEMLRGGQVPGVSSVFDHAAAVESAPNSGLWTPGLVFTADGLGVHINTQGHLTIRNQTLPDARRLAFLRG